MTDPATDPATAAGAAAGAAAPPADLDGLRRRVRAIERGDGPQAHAVLPLGAPALDAALPGGGLARAALHEVRPERTQWDDGAAAGFASVILGRLQAAVQGRVLWIARRGDLYPPGLRGFGVDPDRLMLARADDDAGVLWALEEALRCPALAGAVGEVGALDRTAARRLQLAAEAGGVLGIALLRRRVAAHGRREPSAAATRWQVGALASAQGGGKQRYGHVTRPEGTADSRWHLELQRCRGGPPAAFEVEWDHAAGDFALAAGLRDGPLGGATAVPGHTSGCPGGGAAQRFRRAG
jgi:protein ImuA